MNSKNYDTKFNLFDHPIEKLRRGINELDILLEAFELNGEKEQTFKEIEICANDMIDTLKKIIEEKK